MITETPAVEVAAPAAVEEQEVSLQERLNNATEEEYAAWEKGGEFPPIKPKETPKTETPAVSKEETTSSAAKVGETTAKAETAPATEPGKPQKKRDVDGRVAQLLKERKEAEEKWDARFKELESRLAKPAEPSAKPESSSAAETKATDPEPELGGNNPKTGKPYQSVAEWQKEHTAWLRAQVMAEVEGKLTKTEQQRQQTEAERFLNEGLATKFEVGRKKYPDFDKVVSNPDLYLPRGSAADVFIRNSENAAEVAYYLGQHPEILEGFYHEPQGKDRKKGEYENTIHPSLQMMELARIEARLTGTVQATPPPKPSATTKPLPPPPTVLSGKSSPSGDPADEAVKKRSFSDFEKIENDRERKARRAGVR
jgi:hypothetical protein